MNVQKHWRLETVRSAFDVVTEIVQSNPAIEFLTLVTYSEGPDWRELPHPQGKDEIEFLLAGLQQDRGERALTRLSRNEISDEKIRQSVENLPEHKLLGIHSNVVLARGGEGHIPMMDFMCPPSPENRDRVTRLLASLHLGKGYLLESGESYHYYGFKILSEGWRIFLGKCLLMSGYSDDRYIGHQLVNGYCVLRLSSARIKNRIPTVVAEVS